MRRNISHTDSGYIYWLWKTKNKLVNFGYKNNFICKKTDYNVYDLSKKYQ